MKCMLNYDGHKIGFGEYDYDVMKEIHPQFCGYLEGFYTVEDNINFICNEYERVLNAMRDILRLYNEEDE